MPNRLELDQVRCLVGPGLGPNWVMLHVFLYCFLVCFCVVVLRGLGCRLLILFFQNQLF